MPFLQIIITPTCYSVLILSRPSIDLYIYSDIVFEVQCTNFPKKKSLMGIKRHKIHQGSLCSFVLLGRSLPDIDFETKTTPSAFWCKIHDAGSAVSQGDFTRNLVAEMRCSQKKKLLLINSTLNRSARIYVYIKSLKQHTSLHLPYMRVTDISKHINKNQNGNTVFTML